MALYKCCIIIIKQHYSPTLTPDSSWCMHGVISGIFDCLCPCSKRKTTWAVSTELSTHILYGRNWAWVCMLVDMTAKVSSSATTVVVTCALMISVGIVMGIQLVKFCHTHLKVCFWKDCCTNWTSVQCNFGKRPPHSCTASHWENPTYFPPLTQKCLFQ